MVPRSPDGKIVIKINAYLGHVVLTPHESTFHISVEKSYMNEPHVVFHNEFGGNGDEINLTMEVPNNIIVEIVDVNDPS